MKLIVEGRRYDLADGIKNATLQDLYVLKARQGVGVKTLKATFERMDRLEDPMDLLEDEAGMLALLSMVWLCRRSAGERLSFEEATDVPLAQLGFEVDDEELATMDPTKAAAVVAAREQTAKH